MVKKYQNCKRLAKNIDMASDWLNMFTKASEQLYLSFIFKMPRSRIQQDRHNERRRQAKSKARQAVFAMDFIQIKHPEIYNEAYEFFTLIDSRYPGKYDLRKTNEFLCFKQLFQGKASKNGKGTLYFDIKTATVTLSHSESPPVETIMPGHSESPPVETITSGHSESPPVETITSGHSESPSTETSHSESPSVETSHCENPFMETSHSESPPMETSHSESPSVETSHCENPFMETSHSESPPMETSHSESPSVETSHCENPFMETSHSESPPMETSHSESPQTTETMLSARKQLEPRLEIPLISTQQARKATVTTQTVQITTEQEMPLISFDDIESDTIDQIIEQLRQDPDLTNIFNDIELQMEFDELGQDLDIPELDLLEQELWW